MESSQSESFEGVRLKSLLPQLVLNGRVIMELGSHHTVETKEKLSVVLKGRILSQETRLKMSKARKGHIVSEETRVKIREAKKGHTVVSEATRVKISESGKGNQNHLGHYHTLEARARMSEVKKGKVLSKETRERQSVAVKNSYTDDLRETRRQAMAKRLADSDEKDKIMRASRLGQRVHPNKPETILLELLNIVAPNDWAFVGDGQLIIAGKNPDFANINGKKQLAELFGQYWHGERARCYEETEEGRIALFKKYGYKTLVIWENELKDEEAVLGKIAEFVMKA